MTNYFYDLPIDIQDKIHQEVHKINMEEIKKKILHKVLVRLIKKNSSWLDYQSISPEFWDFNN